MDHINGLYRLGRAFLYLIVVVHINGLVLACGVFENVLRSVLPRLHPVVYLIENNRFKLGLLLVRWCCAMLML